MKYKLLLEEKIIYNDMVLYRIEALIDIPSYGIKVGDKGGYIEKEDNLSQEIPGWIFDGKVFADAKIRGGEIRGGVISGGVIWGGVIRGGEISDGEIRGGEIRGGVIRGGVISGGVIWGGVIRGGEISDGVIRGGVISGGEIRGGEISDGVIRGGVIWGGVIRGGVISGGEWKFSPLQIQGTKYFFNFSTKTTIQIGCINMLLAEWREKGEQIGKKNGFTDEQIQEYFMYLDIAEKWMNLYLK